MNGEQPLVRIIDDEESIREALSFLLGNEGWKTIGYENADTFLRSDSPSTPGCVILDIRMPGMSGLDAQKIMKDRGFVLPIIFLSAHGDIDTAVDTMRLGAFDFIQKPIDPERMTKTVERAIRESIRRSRGILSSEVIAERVNLLTHRERQILQFAQAGLTNKKIAEALNIREKTVESFKTSIFKRFGATSILQVVKRSLKAQKRSRHFS